MRNANNTCLMCKSAFYARPSALAKGECRFCTWKCYAGYSGKIEYPLVKRCSQCDIDFVIKNSRKQRKFCSKSCASKNSNKLRIGKKYKTAEWSFKERLVALLGHACCVCGYSISVDAHHIKHKANGGSDNLENGILLCPNHHREVHLKLIIVDELMASKMLVLGRVST